MKSKFSAERTPAEEGVYIEPEWLSGPNSVPIVDRYHLQGLEDNPSFKILSKIKGRTEALSIVKDEDPDVVLDRMIADASEIIKDEMIQALTGIKIEKVRKLRKRKFITLKKYKRAYLKEQQGMEEVNGADFDPVESLEDKLGEIPEAVSYSQFLCACQCIAERIDRATVQTAFEQIRESERIYSRAKRTLDTTDHPDEIEAARLIMSDMLINIRSQWKLIQTDTWSQVECVDWQLVVMGPWSFMCPVMDDVFYHEYSPTKPLMDEGLNDLIFKAWENLHDEEQETAFISEAEMLDLEEETLAKEDGRIPWELNKQELRKLITRKSAEAAAKYNLRAIRTINNGVDAEKVEEALERAWDPIMRTYRIANVFEQLHEISDPMKALEFFNDMVDKQAAGQIAAARRNGDWDILVPMSKDTWKRFVIEAIFHLGSLAIGDHKLTAKLLFNRSVAYKLDKELVYDRKTKAMKPRELLSVLAILDKWYFRFMDEFSPLTVGDPRYSGLIMNKAHDRPVYQGLTKAVFDLALYQSGYNWND